MLRIGFLPSDFNPMILMLGEAADFRALAGVLRQFARDAADVRFDKLGFCHAGRTGLRLTATGDTAGMRAEAADGFAWKLSRSQAEFFAAQADRLADPVRIAGSEMLECGLQEAIQVKLSRGEYTDDFLREDN
jgi:hypothetical protein